MKLVRALIATVLCLCLIAPFGLQIRAFAEDIGPLDGLFGGDDGISVPSEPRLEPIDDDLPVIDLTENDDRPDLPTPQPVPEPTEEPSETDLLYQSIYDSLMACTTYQELIAIVQGLSDKTYEGFRAWMTDEQYAALEAHINQLMLAGQDNGDVTIIGPETIFFDNAAPIMYHGFNNNGMRGFGTKDHADGLGMSKTAEYDPVTHMVRIKIEVYAEGTVITNVKNIPCDIVLVLDQSGSMAENFSTTTVEGFFPYSSSSTNDNYYQNRDNLYVQLANGQYAKVTVTISGWLVYTYTYSWRDEYGVSRSFSHTNVPLISTQPLPQTVNNFTINNFYYYGQGSVGTSKLQALQEAVTTFANQVANKAKGSDGVLGTDDDVDHRIAIVGFASNGTVYNQSAYENTELFIGANQYIYNSGAQQQYGNAFQDMSTAQGVQNINSSIGAIGAYGATYINLGMEMAQGIINAYPLGQDEERVRVVIVFTDGSPGGNGTWSNDPATNSNYDANVVANQAIPISNTIKNTQNATVYTVGIFDGADGDISNGLPSYHTVNSGSITNTGYIKDNANRFMHLVSNNYPDSQKMDDGQTGNLNPDLPAGTSYYLSAGDAGQLTSVFKTISSHIGNSSVNLGSDTQIKDIVAPSFTLPEGGASSISVTTEDAQVSGNNIGWTNSQAAAGVTINTHTNDEGLEEVDVTGFDFAENFVATEGRPFPGQTTGNQFFGRKLVIEFDCPVREGFLGGNDIQTNGPNSGIYDKDGNCVTTFDQPEPPDIPVATPVLTVDDQNVYLLDKLTKNQLLHGAKITINDVYGNPVVLDLEQSDNYYGLGADHAYQVDYIAILTDIHVDGRIHETGNQYMYDSTAYMVDVIVRPRLNATEAQTHRLHGQEDLYVFLPYFTFNDTDVWYGDAAPVNPNDYDYNNIVSVIWKHGNTLDTDVHMLTGMSGEKPTIGSLTCPMVLTYELPAGAVENGYIATCNDIPVNITALSIEDTVLTDNTLATFLHQTCSHSGCPTIAEHTLATADTVEFYLHPQTCELTIDKNFSGSAYSADDNFILSVIYTNPNGIGSGTYLVDICGDATRSIVRLPIGSYTVTELTDWSWRYGTPTYANATGTLTADAPTATCTVTNTVNNNLWISDETGNGNIFVFLEDVTPELLPKAIIPGKGGIVYEEQ